MNLKAGERAEIEFELSPCEHLSRANEYGLMVIEEGSYFLIVENKEYEIRIGGDWQIHPVDDKKSLANLSSQQAKHH